MKKILLTILLGLSIGCSKNSEVAKSELVDLVKNPTGIKSLKESKSRSFRFAKHIESKHDYAYRSTAGNVPAVAFIPTIRSIIKDAKTFGIDMIIFGDSNSHNLSDDFESATMIGDQFGGAANIGIIGSTSQDWLEIFTAAPDVLISLQSFKYQVISIGGNHVLKEQMSSMRSGVEKMHEFFPRSVLLNMPMYTDSKIIDAKKNIQIGNQILKEVWGEENIVDTFQTTSEGNVLHPEYFYDGLHFVNEFDRAYRIPKVIEKIWIQKIKSGDI